MRPKVIRAPKGLKASKVRAKSVMVNFFVTPFVHTRETGVGITFFQGVLGLLVRIAYSTAMVVLRGHLFRSVIKETC